MDTSQQATVPDPSESFEKALHELHDGMPPHGCAGMCLIKVRAAHAREVAAARREAFEEAAATCARRADGRRIAAYEKRHQTNARKVTTGAKKAAAAGIALSQAAQEIRARAEGGTKGGGG